jgi:hypothetical protein
MTDKSELRYTHYCKTCGRPFVIGWERRRSVYCCEECRREGSRQRNHDMWLKRRKPRPPRVCICVDCGPEFMHQGRGCPKYCDICICKPVGHRRRYLQNRKN